ncbi:MAG TPA: hypothetical protein DCR93_34935 [Cytophagales bacterium]|nr:hypothetical protein [Cytophagales bacterium]
MSVASNPPKRNDMKKTTVLALLLTLTGWAGAQPLALAVDAQQWDRDKTEILTFREQLWNVEQALQAGQWGRAKQLHTQLTNSMQREIAQSEAAVRQAQREVNASRREVRQEKRDLNGERRDARRPRGDRRDDRRDLRDDRRDVRDDQRDLRDDIQDRERREDRLVRQRQLMNAWSNTTWVSEGSARALAMEKLELGYSFFRTMESDLRDDYGEMVEDVAELKEDRRERREDQRERRERY